VNNSGVAGLPGSLSSSGVMGVSPDMIPSLAPAPPPPYQSHQQPTSSVDQGNTSRPTSISAFTPHQGSLDSDHRRQWLPKMDFPKFDGLDECIWLDKCSAYFHLYSIPQDFKVIVASLHMVDKASHWFQTYKHSLGNHTWEHFVMAVSRELEVNTHRVKTMELLNLKQHGSMEEYKNRFDQLVYHILLCDNSLSETMLVS
jgi:hypothetical protein